jgi:histidinol-phosphate aminotransferase
MSGLSERVRSLVRADIARLEPYDPNFTPCAINLSANENTYGLPAGVRSAMDAAMQATDTNRYPDPLANGLRDAIARWHGVRREQVCVGNGGDELLFNFFLAFGGPGRRLVDCPPTFTVYDIYARMVGTEVIRCPRDPDSFELDVPALLEAAQTAQMLIVTSPNNPTGNMVDGSVVARLCEACPGIVLVDEAYVEFAAPGMSCEPLLATYDNLVVLHTFSKAFSLAGVRMGYVLAAPDIVDVLAAVRQPYTVDVFAQAATEVVVLMRERFQPTIDLIKDERERLAQELSAFEGVRAWPSQANFLLVRLPRAGEVRARLRDRFSILVRDFSAAPGLEGCLRVTVGTPEENDALVQAIAKLLKEEQ